MANLRGNYLFDRNSYIACNEPMIFHCHHYNTFLQATIEDTSAYLEVQPILKDAAQELAYAQLSEYFTTNNLVLPEERKKITEEWFAFCGFGKIALDNLAENGGLVTAETEHYSIGWEQKFGHRKEHEPMVSFFASGFLAGATEAIFGLPLGVIETTQTKCFTKGDDICAFNVTLRAVPAVLQKSPQQGIFQVFEQRNASNTTVDSLAIRDALTQMPIQGNHNGMIEAFGVLLTRMYANYYCLISYRMLKALEEKMGDSGTMLASQLLTEAGHVCAFNTFGGIMESAEWQGMIKPMLQNREDWVHGIIAVVNAFGWGQWEIKELVPNQKLVVKITSGYESNSYLKHFGTSNYPISFLGTGGVAGIMNLIYNGDITQNPSLTEDYYRQVCLSSNYFVSKQILCRAMGAEYDLIEVTLKNDNQ